LRYLTTGEVARRCQVSVGTVKNWIEAGRLEAFRTPGRHFRIRTSALRRFQNAFGFSTDPDDRPRILVVDDQPDFVEMAVETLKEMLPGALFEDAAGGYEALLRIGSFQPHLLLLDLRMPGLDGYEVCRRVKEAPESKGTKIIAMTGFSGENAEGLALACGADAFARKQSGLEALARQVKALLDADAAPGATEPSPKRRRGHRLAAGAARASRPKRTTHARRSP